MSPVIFAGGGHLFPCDFCRGRTFVPRDFCRGAHLSPVIFTGGGHLFTRRFTVYVKVLKFDPGKKTQGINRITGNRHSLCALSFVCLFTWLSNRRKCRKQNINFSYFSNFVVVKS